MHGQEWNLTWIPRGKDFTSQSQNIEHFCKYRSVCHEWTSPATDIQWREGNGFSVPLTIMSHFDIAGTGAFLEKASGKVSLPRD
jgi:hypothetical protein